VRASFGAVGAGGNRREHHYYDGPDSLGNSRRWIVAEGSISQVAPIAAILNSARIRRWINWPDRRKSQPLLG
jgi:hypothetical protein